MNDSDRISQTIESWISNFRVSGKMGRKFLQPSLANALVEIGYRAELEDSSELLKKQMPVWRSKDTKSVEPTLGRRRIDIIVYEGDRPAALIEIESDLNDLRQSGVTRRNGHYDVWSIARSSHGDYFDSYKSLERMAAAAFYLHLSGSSGKYPCADEAVRRLESVVSDDPVNHNPTGVSLYLVSGNCRPIDRRILAPRLNSLGAKLYCGKSA